MSGRPALPWWMPIAATAATWILRLLAVTWRLDRSGLRERDAAIAAGEPCLFAFWHSRMLPLVVTHRNRGGVVLVSRHRDGEWISQVLQRMGFQVARGSSTRGGGAGAIQMLDAARAGRMLGITPDGPRGPRERVKPGTVYLASRSGLPVVPITSAARRSWVLNSWDRFRVPMPFAKVIVTCGRPIRVPRDLDEAGAERFRIEIEAALADLKSLAQRQAGEETVLAGAAQVTA